MFYMAEAMEQAMIDESFNGEGIKKCIKGKLGA